MKFTRAILASMMVVSVFAQTNNGAYYDQYNTGQENGYVIGRDIPYTREPVKDYIKRYRFEIDSDKFYGLYDLIFKKIKDRRKILHKTFDISILMKPSKRLLKSVDHIYVASNYITQILFPEKMRVVDAVASFPTTVFDFSQNEIRLRPQKGFSDGNIVVHLSDGTKNYTVNLLVEDYLQKKCQKIEGRYYCKNMLGKIEPTYKYAYENVSLIYRYVDAKPLDDIAVFHMYKKLHGHDVSIKKDGDFVSFEYKNVTYHIYRNDRFGNIFYKGRRYLVAK